MRSAQGRLSSNVSGRNHLQRRELGLGTDVAADQQANLEIEPSACAFLTQTASYLLVVERGIKVVEDPGFASLVTVAKVRVPAYAERRLVDLY